MGTVCISSVFLSPRRRGRRVRFGVDKKDFELSKDFVEDKKRGIQPWVNSWLMPLISQVPVFLKLCESSIKDS